jgi:hypothetical protein
MGYACPVCETPQADARHLANHLAFTAVLRGGDHEEWLDEHAPGWSEEGEDALAERVVEHAEEASFPDLAAEDEAAGHGHERGGEHHHAHDQGHDAEVDADAGPGRFAGQRPSSGGSGVDPGTADVLERARDLTRRRRANRDAAREGSDGGETGDTGGGDESESDPDGTGGERDGEREDGESGA